MLGKKKKNSSSNQSNSSSKKSDIPSKETSTEELKSKKDLNQECQEYLEGWRRAQADYQNLQRQFEQSKKEYIDYANENLLTELLPAIEQFELALAYLPDLSNLPPEEKEKLDKWFVGIKAVKQMWEQTFDNIGLTTIDTSKTFNPQEHNAVSKESDSTKPKDAILKVVQVGWKFKDKVLRPAKVVVNSLEDSNQSIQKTDLDSKQEKSDIENDSDSKK